jgi:hypothetical protein
MAKDKVKSLSEEFNQLKGQLDEQVKNLKNARTSLVKQISGIQGVPILADEDTSEQPETAEVAPEDEATDESPVAHLRDAAAEIASAGSPADAGEAGDAATAAEHALHYTEQVASRVGDLADQSEEQAERIVDAARLTQVHLHLIFLFISGHQEFLGQAGGKGGDANRS